MKINIKLKELVPIPPMSEDDSITYFMMPIHINDCGLLKEVLTELNYYNYYLAYSSTNERYLCSSAYNRRNVEQILEFHSEWQYEGL